MRKSRRFTSIEHGLTFCRKFFPWYQDEHHHWGLGLMTPATIHTGRATEVLTARQVTLSAVYIAMPERFVHRGPRPQQPSEAVWINPPAATQNLEEPLLTLH